MCLIVLRPLYRGYELIRVFPVVFQKEAGTAAPVLTLKQHDDDHDHVELADVIKKKNDTLFHYTTNK